MSDEYKDPPLLMSTLGLDHNIIGGSLISGLSGKALSTLAAAMLHETGTLANYKKLFGAYYTKPGTPKLYPTAHNYVDAYNAHSTRFNTTPPRIVRNILRQFRLDKDSSNETLLAQYAKELEARIPNPGLRKVLAPMLTNIYRKQNGIDVANAGADIGYNRLVLNNGKLPGYGILAHELGHLQSSMAKIKGMKFLIGAGPVLTGASALLPARAKTEEGALLGAGLGSLTMAPRLVEEVGASYRGAKLLRQAGLAGGPTLKGKLGLLKPFIGVPTYVAGSTLPFAVYGVKKYRGGYDNTTKQACNVLRAAFH